MRPVIGLFLLFILLTTACKEPKPEQYATYPLYTYDALPDSSFFIFQLEDTASRMLTYKGKVTGQLLVENNQIAGGYIQLLGISLKGQDSLSSAFLPYLKADSILNITPTQNWKAHFTSFSPYLRRTPYENYLPVASVFSLDTISHETNAELTIHDSVRTVSFPSFLRVDSVSKQARLQSDIDMKLHSWGVNTVKHQTDSTHTPLIRTAARLHIEVVSSLKEETVEVP